MQKPSAKIIADSIGEHGIRLTTMEVTMHRFILAEMNTHRAFSRNSASSRAIPFMKTLGRVQSPDTRCYPIYWGKEQRGMQSGEEFTDYETPALMGEWDNARHYATHYAGELHNMGLHKSLVNRLLEPFMWHTAIITATDWDNFFWQRCHPDAQPEMKAVADEMQRAYYTHNPKALAYGEWHLPYISSHDWQELQAPPMLMPQSLAVEQLKRVSTARCARVSYLTHDGNRDLTIDLGLFEKLKGSGHWSPFEHVAMPITINVGYERQGAGSDYVGNFRGWKQFRKEFRDENRTNFVPNLPDLLPTRERSQYRGQESTEEGS